MSETKLIYKKMSDVMRDVGAISKDQKNTAQGFKFRGIDQFVNALYPALTKHNVFMTPFCVNETHELKEVTRSSGKTGVDKHVTIMMGYNFYAEDGSYVTVGPIPAEGLDSGDKATNKALSAALKYALIQTFSIPTEDMAEADLESPEISKVAKVNPTPTNTLVIQGTGDTMSGTIAVTPGTTPVVGTATAKISTFRKNKVTPPPTVTVVKPTDQAEEWS